MKKLMVALAAVAVGLAAQAAVVDWQYRIEKADTTGGLDYSKDYSVYLVDAAAWDALGGKITTETFADSSIVYGKTGFAAGSGKSASSKTFASLKSGTTAAGLSVSTVDGATAGNTYDFYYVVVNEGADPNEYSVSAKQALMTRTGDGTAIGDNAVTVANSTVAAGWTAVGGDVPEPTSGLLLLLGVAGLALRRKNA